MTVSDRYRSSWDGYWEQSSGEAGEPFWDADPALTARRDLDHLTPYADHTLPIADLGCGNGTQTRFLATRFSAAVGVDLSAAAVAHARRADPDGVATYEQLNLADPAQADALHDRLGDTNVYMRAVLHQSDPEDRPAVAATVARLVGAHGRALVLEPTGAAKEVIAAIAAQPGGPSLKLRRVKEHDLRPGEVAEGEVAALLRETGLTLLAEGTTALVMSETHPDGTAVELPARWFVAGRP
ncbi:class I SAM-dependent methyltransferase [Streptomyces sp. NBC_00083]|uniref:class I SAM-dependent methyltransferase n=1 Tax=Streptomyces sp. NBC_00083 TaxID=2975647 RepID=UPI0022542D29|nr:class I SAM-dependent methyltransferase [Streptomyces sp. NBC_00083]MCX5384564.1 class I SAM-dependent methyltransferase [Streptomyces sp. NBC_00083]